MIDYRLIPSFCINLDSRPDRWMSVQDEFRKLDWPVRRVSAVVHKKSTPNGLTPGRAGVMDSHKKVWSMIAAEKFDIAAVFEDDVVFPSDFFDIFPKAYEELPKDWKVWHLHSFGPRQMNRIVPNGLYTTKLERNGWGAHGYVIKKEIAPVLLDYASSGKNIADILLTSGLLSRGTQPYGTMPKFTLCFQNGMDSNIPETAQVNYWKNAMKMYNR